MLKGSLLELAARKKWARARIEESKELGVNLAILAIPDYLHRNGDSRRQRDSVRACLPGTGVERGTEDEKVAKQCHQPLGTIDLTFSAMTSRSSNRSGSNVTKNGYARVGCWLRFKDVDAIYPGDDTAPRWKLSVFHFPRGSIV